MGLEHFPWNCPRVKATRRQWWSDNMRQVMAWCHQAMSHYLNQCWPNSVAPYGITKPQWVKGTSRFNSLRPSDAYMHQFNIHIPTLVQIMACCLLDIKPLFKPMLPYCWLDPKEHISMKSYLKFKSFSSRKCTWKCHLQNGSHFISALICDIYDINPICDTIL